jgi:hypothetical protein
MRYAPRTAITGSTVQASSCVSSLQDNQCLAVMLVACMSCMKRSGRFLQARQTLQLARYAIICHSSHFRCCCVFAIYTICSATVHSTVPYDTQLSLLIAHVPRCEMRHACVSAVAHALCVAVGLLGRTHPNTLSTRLYNTTVCCNRTLKSAAVALKAYK